jgi:hypothetical protein
MNQTEKISTHTLSSAILIVLASMTFVPFLSHAGLFKIANRTYGSLTGTEYQVYLDNAFDQLETEVNSKLPASTASTYLRSISNSAHYSGMGNTSDASTIYDYLLVGIGGGAAAELGGTSIQDLMNNSSKSTQVSGFALQGNLLIGLNLAPFLKSGFFEQRPLKIYFNTFSQSLKVSDVSGQISSLGLQAQWKFYPEKDLGYGSLKWTGLDLLTGYRQTKTRLTINKSITQTTTQTFNAPTPTTAEMTFNGAAEVGANIDVKSIPIEITTGARLLYVFNFFFGVGLDYAWGKSDSIASISGPVTVNTNPSMGNVSGDATLDLGENTGPKATHFRYLYGMQLEFGVMALAIQMNQSFDRETTGASFMAKFYY